MAEKTTYEIALIDKLSPGLKKATHKAMGLDRAMGKVGGKARKGSRGMKSFGSSLGATLGPLALLTVGIAAATAAMRKMFEIGSESVQIARKFESLTNAINFASGGLKEGAETMEFLRQRSDLLGTDLLASTEGFKTLSAAMLGSKLQGQGTKDIFDGVQVAATAMGLSSEDAKGTFLALGQIMGKGKVQAEELRGQIGERIPGAFNIAARAMGVTTAELNKMMEQGQLISEDFLPKFSNELKKTFGKALPTAVQSSQAQFNRFNNTMLDIKLTIGRTLMPLVNKFMGMFSRLVNILKANKTALIQAFQPAIDLFRELKKEWAEFFSRIFGDASTMDILRIAINSISEGLRPLLAMFKMISTVTLGLMEGLFGAVDFFSSIISGLSGMVMGFQMAFKEIGRAATHTFSGVGDILAGVFSADPEQIEKGIKRVSFGATVSENSPKRIKAAYLRGVKAASAGGSLIDVVGLIKKKSGLKDVLKQTTTGDGSGAGAAAGGIGGKKSSSLTGVKSGRPTHINIDIGKLIETFNITTTNMNDTTNMVKDKIAQTLLSAVNNVNNIAR